MKRIILAAASLAALSFGSSAMATDSPSATTVNLSATVPQILSLGSATLSTGAGAVTGSSSPYAVEYAPDAEGKVAATTSTITWNDAWTNSAHTLHVKSANGGLTNTTTSVVGGAFDTKINYVATYGWSGTSGALGNPTSINTASGAFDPPASAQGGAIAGKLELKITTFATGRLVAGGYTDTVTATIATTL